MDTIEEVQGVLLYLIVLHGYNRGSARGATVPVTAVTQQLIVNDKLCSHSISLVSVHNVVLPFRSFVATCFGIFFSY